VEVLATENDSNDEFDSLLRSGQVPVLGYLVRLTGQLADARDLLQVTNVTAWQKRADFETGTNFVAWMRAIALNHYRNETRKAVNRRTVPLLDRDLEQMVEHRHEERELEDARKRRLLSVCLKKLPERQADAITAFYLEGQSLETIAASTGHKPNAIGQLLHRARQNLIQCVREESHGELDSELFSES
jgi:RNA polymerase sigma-70 factor